MSEAAVLRRVRNRDVGDGAAREKASPYWRIEELAIATTSTEKNITQLGQRLALINTRIRLCQLRQSAEACFRAGEPHAIFGLNVGESVVSTVYPCYSKHHINKIVTKAPNAVVSIVELWDGAVTETEGWRCAHKSIHPVEDTIEQVSLHISPFTRALCSSN